jgi:glyoxylase-like metal-dependent hydrolase (beta-lactamase superfamily II)
MMLGTISITRSHGVSFHTYTAPEDGWCVNTHIFELATQLIVLDAQYMLKYAREVLDYAATLRKSVTRLYISHYHPDHLLGAAAFSAPIYALPEVKAKIEAAGDRVAAEEHEKHGDLIPAHAERPSQLVTPGLETIDGIRLEFFLLRHAETEAALVVGLPDHGILATQDLIYNQVHVFLGEKAFASWADALDKYQKLAYTRILPGHGAPGGAELFDAMRHYLSAAQEALSQADDPADLKCRLIAAFPDSEGHALLDHQMRFLFPPRNQGTTKSSPSQEVKHV